MILFIVILAVAIFIVALIAIPWRIDLIGSVGTEGAEFDAHIGLIHGLIAFRFAQRETKYLEFRPLNLKLFRKELNGKEKGKGKEEGKGRVNWFFRLPQLMENAQETPELRIPFSRLLSKLRGAIKIKDLSINSRVGLEDPYVTGVFYGYYTAFSALGNWMPYGVYLQPDFVNEGLQGDIYAELEIIQISLVIPLLLLVTKKSFRDVVRSFRGKESENE